MEEMFCVDEEAQDLDRIRAWNWKVAVNLTARRKIKEELNEEK